MMQWRCFGLGLAAAGLILAQPHTVTITQGGPAHGFEFIAADGMMPGKVVTGAPYSAEGVTDYVQTLADGTRITRRSTNRVVRDSQGRTRDERTMPAIGPWASSGEAPRIVTIMDPVAKEMIVLNEREKVAAKHKLPDFGHVAVGEKVAAFTAARPVGATFHTMADPPAGGVGGVAMASQSVMVFHRSDGGDGKEEALGKQTLEGLVCEGKRFSHSIPAGEVGNDRPMTTTIERWTSADLQVLVRSTTKDPMSGETTYRLTSVSRAEPARTLFAIPAEYTVREEKPAPMRIHEVIVKEKAREK
ncbi:MAG: hypothetical protein U0Q16_07655 [Bryobacteraceae bacterium]